MKFWTIEETDILKQQYPTKTPQELQKLLPNRTPTAISRQAHNLKLKKIAYFWTDEELHTLKKVYANLSKQELLKTFDNKDWTSIRHKAFELDLKKAPHMRYSANWKNHGNLTIKLNDFERGWISAIIDGEGMIRISKANDKRWKKGHCYLSPLISVVNTDVKLMARVRDILKVGRFYKEKSKMAHHKDKYVYNIGSINGCKQILEQIKTDLVIKRRQAEAVLKLINIKEKKETGLVTKEEFTLFEEVKRLNARGSGAKF